MLAAGDLTLLGGNQMQDLQVAGQASDTVFSTYERMTKAANNTHIQVANQYIDGTREILRTGTDAYYKQSGADALVGAGATIEKLTHAQGPAPRPGAQ